MDDYSQRIIKRYTERYEKHGYSPQALGWGKGGRQEIRFEILTSTINVSNQTSILDIGCGFADLYEFLIQKGWQGSYTGIEIVPVLAQEAQRRNPSIQVIASEFMQWKCDDNEYDYCIASGIFNAQDDPNMKNRIESMLKKMFAISKKAVSVDFMSSFVDYHEGITHHTNPVVILDFAFTLTKRIMMRHDYMPYEFALHLLKDQQINPQNIYSDFHVSE